jgi:hypothetical protein
MDSQTYRLKYKNISRIASVSIRKINYEESYRNPGLVKWDLWWTKWRWGRFFPSTSVTLANLHSTKFSIIIITRGRYKRPFSGRRAEWTQLGLHPPPPLSELKNYRLRCDAVQSGRNVSVFPRNVLPSSSWTKSKRSKESGRSTFSETSTDFHQTTHSPRCWNFECHNANCAVPIFTNFACRMAYLSCANGMFLWNIVSGSKQGETFLRRAAFSFSKNACAPWW